MMNSFLLWVLISIFVRYSISVQKKEFGDSTGKEIEESALSESVNSTAREMREAPSTRLTNTTKSEDDQDIFMKSESDVGPSNRSVVKVEREIDARPRRRRVGGINYEDNVNQRSQVAQIKAEEESPPIDVNDDTQYGVDVASQSGSQFAQATRRWSLAELKSFVETENFCESIYNTEDVEKLLHYDDMTGRAGGNWWKIGGFFFGGEGVNVTRPMCSTFPLIRSVLLSRKISEHEFFQSRKINIPPTIGRHGFRLVDFHHINRTSADRVILECACQILDENIDNNEAKNICVQGKIVNLSRGVGGNQSFFVYTLNPQTSRFYATAHICFT